MNHRRSRSAILALGLSSLAVAVAPSIASAASVGESYNAAIASGSESLGSFTSFRYSPAVAATQQPTVVIGIMDPVLGLAESPALYNKAFGPAIHSNPTFDLTGGGHSTDIGPLLAGNTLTTACSS